MNKLFILEILETTQLFSNFYIKSNDLKPYNYIEITNIRYEYFKRTSIYKLFILGILEIMQLYTNYSCLIGILETFN